MKSALAIFNQNIVHINETMAIYDRLIDDMPLLTSNFDEMLRSCIVNIVSSLDYFIHQILKASLIDSVLQNKLATSKGLSFPLRLSTVQEISRCARIEIPTTREDTIEYWLDLEISKQLNIMSFQRSEKIKDALSHIWQENHKMQVLAKDMDSSVFPVSKTTINDKVDFLCKSIDLIASRRNQIVHEADYDIANLIKSPIDKRVVSDAVKLIKYFVYAIYKNITGEVNFERI